MSRFGLRERIAVGAVAASAAALLAVLALVGPDLRRRTVEHTDTPSLAGMLRHVKHLVRVEGDQPHER